MTGRELIIYILKNSLEDAEIHIKDDLISNNVDTVPIEEVAAITGLGLGSLDVWCSLGYLDKVVKNDKAYIVRNDKFKVFTKLRENFK